MGMQYSLEVSFELVELVGGLPERGFDFLDVLQGVVSQEALLPG
jgi:hypothetical protein